MGRAIVAAFALCAVIFFQGANSAVVFTVINKCPDTIWPGVMTFYDLYRSPTTGFELATGASVSLEVNDEAWYGEIWARTNCSTDSNGTFSCLTGDCGSGKVECIRNFGDGPVTRVKFALKLGVNDSDEYSISLTGGFNLPVAVSPHGASDCRAISCPAHINENCPPRLQAKAKDGSVVGCKSSCLAFATKDKCCKGVENCDSTDYSEFFHTACPDAYYLSRNEPNATLTCRDSDFGITFCPSN